MANSINLPRILAQHKAWLDSSSTEGSRANLSRADLSDADLAGTNLVWANLGKMHVIQVDPIGSRRDTLVYKWGLNGSNDAVIDEAMTGCFSGTLDELAEAVQKTHGNNKFGQEYQAALTFIKALKAVQ